MTSESRSTALTSRHEDAGAKMVDFAGWLMPIEFETGIVAEHDAVRTGCGVFDVSHMGTLRVRGEVGALNELLTNDLRKLSPGQVQYTLLCNEAGGVLDDLLVTLLSEKEMLLVPNASNTDAVKQALSGLPDGALADESRGTSILAVQGPTSGQVVERLGLPADGDYMSATRSEFSGQDILVSRTGYTGEHGYELLIPNSVAGELWDRLIADEHVTACGLGARDTLRLEMGYPLHGQDISPAITPVEAGLSWAVGWDKTVFAGDTELRTLRESGPTRRLRGVQLMGRGVLRPGMSVLRDGREIGALTSGSFSPSLGTGIGLALVEAGTPFDAEVEVQVRNRTIPAKTVRPPFVSASPKI